MRLRDAAIVVMFALAPGDAARAQLAGALPVPSLPVGSMLQRAVDPILEATPVRGTLDAVRRTRIDDLLRTERARVDADPSGAPVLRAEYLATSPDAATIDAVRGAGFDIVRRVDESDALGLEIVVLRDTRNRSATRAMRDLHAAAPQGEFAYQHVYLPAGDAPPTPTSPATAAARASSSAASRIGLVDGGVADAAALSSVSMRRFGCEGRVVADAHATAVALRLAGGTRDTLYAADLWCGDRVGRATLGLVQALGWMAREKVPVVNVSLVGPDNPVLARAVQALIARGHVVVAAVGNDGPAAPPLYPASYPGVIGVAGVDAKLRVLPESASGPQVDFCASGVVDARTRGTSFAAPIIARWAAAIIDAPAPDATTRVQAELRKRAQDLGARGRDPRYGDGYLSAF